MWGGHPLSAISEDGTPKPAPPPATPVTFPSYPDCTPSRLALDEKIGIQDLQRLFLLTRRLLVKPRHISAINLQHSGPLPLESLIPSAYLPPANWENDPALALSGQRSPTETAPSSQTLSNGAAVPGHEVYYLRKKELEFDSRDVYHVLSRGPPRPDRKDVRVSHFRKFWTVLQQVGQYWDTSQDNLDEIDGTGDSITGEKEAEAEQSNSTVMEIDSPASGPSSTSISFNSSSTTSFIQPVIPKSEVSTAPPSPRPPLTYTGRRTSAGASMPPVLRSDLMTSFLDPLIWPFGCRASLPRLSRSLYISHMRNEIEHLGFVHRTPQDRTRNRAGFLEGPMLAFMARGETGFGGDGEDEGSKEGKKSEDGKRKEESEAEKEEQKRKARLDILRETAALVILAQERGREGKEEKVAGVGQWWAERKRWGGGSGEAVGRPLVEDEEDMPTEVADEMAKMARERGRGGGQGEREPKRRNVNGNGNGVDGGKGKGKSSGVVDKERERQRRAKKHKEMMRKNMIARAHEMPRPAWDKKVEYMRIGKDRESEYDDLYLLSSLNHHISIVRLRLHPRFLEYLSSSPSEDFPLDLSWYSLLLERSRWFDLFYPEDRVQAMRGVWGIIAWLMRDTESEGDSDGDSDGDGVRRGETVDEKVAKSGERMEGVSKGA